MTKCDGKDITISKDILEHEMNNASVFVKEEKLSLTKVVKILKDARSSIFTICFTCKVDEKAVQERLKTITEKDFKDSKALAKELLVGRESTLVGRLSKSENHLGRSLIVGVGGDKPTFS